AAGGGGSDQPTAGSQLAADGSTLAFASQATNLLPGGTSGLNSYVWRNGALEQVNFDENGGVVPASVGLQTISDDGNQVLLGTSGEPYGLPAGSGVVLRRTLDDGVSELVAIGPLGTVADLVPRYSSSDGRYFLGSTTTVENDTERTFWNLWAIDDISIASVVPAVVEAGSVTAVTITGTGFELGGVVPDITSSGGLTTFANVTVVDDTTLTADMSVSANAPAGTQLVVGSLAGTLGPGTGATALCVCVTATVGA
ncbi:MAG: hypothetical protein ACR2QE_01285, partial [Acidimicrobiales bacterium]